MKAIACLFVAFLLIQQLAAQATSPKEVSLQVGRLPRAETVVSVTAESKFSLDAFRDSTAPAEKTVLAGANSEEAVATSPSVSATESSLSIPPAGETMLLAKPAQAKAEKPAISARQRHIWLGLVVAEHGAAVVDAWSTRDAIRSGGAERNPFVRPFSHNAAVYPALQILPVGLDYLSQRWMRSNHRLLRTFWWVPQTVSTAGSLACGISNLKLKSSPQF